MVNVFIRDEDETRGALLGQCAIDRLDWLLTEVGRWGIYDGADVRGKRSLSGQFCYQDGEAFFEIIISADDEAQDAATSNA